jgi:hypothetical protein
MNAGIVERYLQMNEFSKEELEQLLFDIDAKIFMMEREKSYIDADYLKLRDKIQRMIETYDEPEYCAHSGAKLEK